MAKMVKKSFDAPAEIRSFDKSKIEVVDLGDVKAMRVTNQPGWRWSECVKPIVGTGSCQVGHLIHVLSGRIVVRMDDGSEAEFGPGDVGSIPPRARRVDSWERTFYQHRLRGCCVRQTAKLSAHRNTRS
jgi:hypothetical protein